MSQKTVRIMGTHGVPANYGGFETAAENVGLFLVRRGWRVIMYCQVEGTGPIQRDTWNGMERVMIPIDVEGWKGTSKYDLIGIRNAARHKDLVLTFGYNTGIFQGILRARRIPNVVNMDGIEWSRSRWGFTKQAILYVNERFSALFGNHLIADHPEIEKYLWTRAPKRKITTITYGADPVGPEDALVEGLPEGVEPGKYFNLIARPIPENSILEIVQGFSQKERGVKLVILGNFLDDDEYHQQVLKAASDEVLFVGAIYEPERVKAIRYHSLGYLHGHTVGGTNPSLVEAMAAGNPVIAHDNPYNRWVAQDGGVYFETADDVAAIVDDLLSTPDKLARMKQASLDRHASEFTWDHVAGQYEELLLRFHP